jgi:hypothetical protein
MLMKHRIIFISILLIMLLSAACSSDHELSAAIAVEQYYQALVEKNENKMIDLSCAAWEPDAKLMYDSFAAVDLSLDNLSCQQTEEGANRLVSCSGVLIASYGAENLEIDIAERTYIVVNEGGEWRVCGFQGD